jgi:HlyD family secretion protein
MKNKLLFTLAAAGVLFGLYSAYVFSRPIASQPPVFNPAPNPYAKGIYANGIIESFQSQGANVNIYPEVAGPITQILVAEGASVRKGTPLVTIDDAIQRATVDQLRAQADASLALLEELRAEPRPESLDIAHAQVVNATATLKNARDTVAKLERAYALEPRSVSQDSLDSARNAVAVADTNLKVVERQYDLTKAGAWRYDVTNQERQHEALVKAAAASTALLQKYTIRAPIDGIVLSMEAAVGSYVSTQGSYDTYTQGFGPIIVMGTGQDCLEVRAYVDEILVHELPAPSKMTGRMFIRGTDTSVPLTFVRVQPYVSPKIELSDQRQERVDVRVLPVLFQFDPPPNVTVYPGQLVDVYIGEK